MSDRRHGTTLVDLDTFPGDFFDFPGRPFIWVRDNDGDRWVFHKWVDEVSIFDIYYGRDPIINHILADTVQWVIFSYS